MFQKVLHIHGFLLDKQCVHICETVKICSTKCPPFLDETLDIDGKRVEVSGGFSHTLIPLVVLDKEPFSTDIILRDVSFQTFV